MKNNRIISKQNTGKLFGAFLALVIPVVYTAYLMFDYDYSFTDARTNSFTSHIEVQANGDVRFEESRTRYLNYSVIEQSLYFTADDEDISNDVHTPEFDVTTFANRVYDQSGDLLIEGDGTQAVHDTVGYEELYLTYSWLPNAVNELGERFYPEDDQSVNLLHYNSGLWDTARFEYDYTIKGAAIEYADTSEFFWTVAATDYMLTKDIDVTIVLPGTDYDVSDVDVYAFGANRVKIASVSKNADQQVEVRLTASRLFPDEYIVTRINFPTSALNIPNNNYGNLAPTITHLPNVAQYQGEYELMPKVYVAVDVVAWVLAAILIAYAGFGIYKIYLKYDKERTSSFYGEYYRELPAEYGPAVMGYLYRFKEITKDDVSATLMDLVRRGYLEIDAQGQSLTDKKANYTLRYRRDKDQSDLQEHEKQLLKWFFDTVAQGDTLTLDQLDNYSKTEAKAIAYMNENQRFNRAAQNAAQAEQFFDDVKEARGKGTTLFYGLTLGGAILIIARLLFSLGTWTIILGGLLVAVGIFISAYASSIERRSEKGNEDFLRWQAFEKFLKEFSNIKDYPMPGILVWEHYMVYAVAFGIADLVEKQLRYKYKQLRQEDELQSSSFFRYPGLHYYYWSGINRSFMKAQQTIQVAQQQRNSARGGGGRFGGGGGMHFGGGGSGVRLR